MERFDFAVGAAREDDSALELEAAFEELAEGARTGCEVEFDTAPPLEFTD